MNGNQIYLVGCIVLGVLAILSGVLLPDKLFLPRKKKYKEKDPKTYIRSCRRALFYLGIYYIVLGISWVYIFNNPVYSLLYEFMLPILTMLPLIVIIKKYT